MLVLSLCLLAACGQKGPLYLPAEEDNVSSTDHQATGLSQSAGAD